jgi:hypothetical protein
MQLLAEGKPLDAQAHSHLASCEGCSALAAVLNEDLGSPSPERMETIASQFGAAFKAVRPLPSNAVLLTISLGIFLALSLIVASVTGLKAISVLSDGQMVLYYGALLLFAILYSRATIEQMIPGSKRVTSTYLLPVLAVCVLGLLLFVLFQNRSTENFVSQGLPCLKLGALTALLTGLLGWRLLYRGYLVAPREALTLYGFFAGLAGVAVLALHCPILNSLHILVWHIGAMLLAGIAGLLLGSIFENSSDAAN